MAYSTPESSSVDWESNRAFWLWSSIHNSSSNDANPFIVFIKKDIVRGGGLISGEVTEAPVAEACSPSDQPPKISNIMHLDFIRKAHRPLRIKVHRKLPSQDKPSRLASNALQHHEPKSASVAATECSFLHVILRTLSVGCVLWNRCTIGTLRRQRAKWRKR